MKLLLTMMLAVALIACGGQSVAPADMTIAPLTRDNTFGSFRLLLYDDSDLVASGRVAVPDEALVQRDGVSARPDQNELDIRWTGGACAHSPTLHISGDATDLQLVLDASPPEFQLPFVECPAVGIPMGVTLTLSVPVGREDIGFSGQD